MEVVCRTHDHPWIKAHLLKEDRDRRRLTKIENGIPKRGDRIKSLGEPFLIENLGGRCSVLPFFYIEMEGTGSEKRALLTRIGRLSKSRLGSQFLKEVEDLGETISLSIRKWKEIEQIIVSYPLGVQTIEFPQEKLPLEWMNESVRVECDQILEEIESGKGVITINDAHPQKGEILELLRKLTMRPSGAALLRRLNGFGEKNIVQIFYKKGKNDEKGISSRSCIIHIDIESEDFEWSIKKTSDAYTNLSNWPLSTVAHELIHALHDFLVYFENEKEISLDSILKESTFCPIRERYESPFPGMTIYEEHSNYDEQRTIIGVPGDPNPSCEITENSVRSEWFQRLRIGHRAGKVEEETRYFYPELITEENPLRFERFTSDDLEVAIRKGEMDVAIHLLTKMKRRQATSSLFQLLIKIRTFDLKKRLCFYNILATAMKTKKVFSTFAINQCDLLIFPSMEKKDLCHVVALINCKLPVKALKDVEGSLKILKERCEREHLVKEVRVINRYLRRIEKDGFKRFVSIMSHDFRDGSL